jgi:glutaconate CoA-transferase subunit A
MSRKLCSMKEAISESVHDGDSLVIDGFTHLICFAAGHEIIRQGRRCLTAIRLTPDLVYDQLIEAGCVDKLVFSWAGNPGVGSLHGLRRKSEASSKERIVLEEYSHFGLLARFMAGSAGLPFWPLDNYAGTSIPDANPAIKTVECPYTGRRIATVPALRPDVAIVHCQRVRGQARHRGRGADRRHRGHPPRPQPHPRAGAARESRRPRAVGLPPELRAGLL